MFYVDQSGIEADRIGTRRSDPNENSIKLSNVFAILLCKFKNFVNTRHCRINLIYVHYMHFINTRLETERKYRQRLAIFPVSKSRIDQFNVCQ